MADLPGLNLSKTAVNQRLDLKEITGVDFASEPVLRSQIGQAIIDHIIERTQNENVDVDGRAFAEYSEAYKNSTVYKLLKSGDDVNMTLTSNMLGDLDLIGDSANHIIFGFRDSREILKAFNHNTGDTVPRRAFFGVTKKEVLDLIDKNFKADIDRLRSNGPRTVADVLGTRAARATTVRNLVFRTVRDILGG